MAFTYDISTNRGKVRHLIPDQDSSNYELDDTEIDWHLTERGNNVKAAAVDACRWLARKYAQQFSFSADGVNVQLAQRAEMFARRAAELARELGGAYGTITLDREDGYSEQADDTEYPSTIIFVRT